MTSEQEFLKNYNPLDYDSFALTSDILLFSVSTDSSDNYRRLAQKKFSILLVKRNSHPFLNKWCLPGGFVQVDEEIPQACKRILAKEANLHNIYLEQLFTFGGINRDPRMRVICCSYLALIDKNQIREQLKEEACWFNISYQNDHGNIKIVLDNKKEQLSFSVKSNPNTDCGYEIVQNDDLAFDCPLVITTGIERLKNKIEYTDIVFNMMPKLFTLKELQQVYEVILNKPLLDASFRRMIASKVEKTNQLKTGEGHRPSILYQYKKG